MSKKTLLITGAIVLAGFGMSVSAYGARPSRSENYEIVNKDVKRLKKQYATAKPQKIVDTYQTNQGNVTKQLGDVTTSVKPVFEEAYGKFDKVDDLKKVSETWGKRTGNANFAKKLLGEAGLASGSNGGQLLVKKGSAKIEFTYGDYNRQTGEVPVYVFITYKTVNTNKNHKLGWSFTYNAIKHAVSDNYKVSNELESAGDL